MRTSFATTTSIVLAGGCFWCLEAVFKRLNGIISVTSGYTGGNIENPSYEAVCTGKTGHAEAVHIVFNPSIISLEKILNIFWELHDPTTLNRQGNDSGTQYRSAIFYTNDTQKEIAEKSLQHITAIERYDNPIITEITKLATFYPAEQKHVDFYNQNRTNSYCRLVIDPKIEKLYKKFPSIVVEQKNSKK